MHRVLAGLHHDRVDHENHDGLDNRDGNLRPCSHAQNLGNQRRGHAASGFKGVYPEKKRWVAKFREKRLGSFSTSEAAAAAYDAAAKAYYGEFALTNAMLGLLPSEAADARD